VVLEFVVKNNLIGEVAKCKCESGKQKNSSGRGLPTQVFCKLKNRRTQRLNQLGSSSRRKNLL
jgi:hypothetical protein